MRAKNSSYAWSLVNCRLHQRLSLHDFRCTNSTLEFQYHSVCKKWASNLGCTFSVSMSIVVVVFFLILSHLFWWLLEVMGNQQNIVFFLLFGWKWQCVHPFRWVFQNKAQTIPHLHQSKLWNINNVLELLYVNFLFQSDSSERLWKLTGIVFGFLNFRLQHLWTFPRNDSGLWLLDFHRLHQRILSHKWHVLAFSKFVVSSPVVTILMDMVDISYTFPKMNDELFCKILIFSRFVSRDWLHIKLIFRSLACKEEAISWRPVFLIFICKTLFWFFSQVSIPSVENSKSA